MMQYHIAVQARQRPETLERVLRVVRHRGFTLCAMNVETSVQAGSINIELTVESLRPVKLLSSQLTKLVDVACVEVQRNALQQISA